MTPYEQALNQTHLDWENQHNHCNVIIVRDEVVYSNIYINGSTVVERSKNAEDLLILIAEQVWNDEWYGAPLSEEYKDEISSQGYLECPDGSIACITWSSPGVRSYPDESFNLTDYL